MSSSSEIETCISENNNNGKDSVASRKLAAAEYRRARKAARDPRNRLLSDSSDENYQVPKGILKNTRIPTKRSVSECVDDLSQIMADLDLNIHDLPKATGKFCLHQQYFDEHEEDKNDDCDNEFNDSKSEKKIKNSWIGSKKNMKCDCNLNGDKYKGKPIDLAGGDEDREDDEGEEKPKKSVRFDEKVYETVFFASRLYDRRYFSKYHFSTRHHPQNNHKQNNNNKSNNNNKKNRQRSKSESDGDLHSSFANLKSDNSCTGGNGCKLSKSQRAKQSKKDKKKRLNNRKEDSTDTNSDDQGYHSHSFSD